MSNNNMHPHRTTQTPGELPFQLIVNEASRFVWGFPVKLRPENPQTLMEFQLALGDRVDALACA